MKKNLTQRLALSVVVLLWAALAIGCWCRPAASFSRGERRKLNQFPKPSVESITSGSFMKKFDQAATDQLPFREEFRGLRAVSEVYVLQKSDTHGIYLNDGYLAEMIYPLKADSVQNAGEKCRKLYETYFMNTDARVYLAIIPDKNYYLGAGQGYLTMDYDACSRIMEEELNMAEVIPLADTLSVDSYYRTDTHWRQEQLEKTAERILTAMGGDAFDDLQQKTAVMDFQGVYAGQSALPVKGEPICYLTNDTLEQCRVYNVETGMESGIYHAEKLEGRDPYDFFLSGSAAILTIENPAGESGRELIVFRDSFGSSMIPLLLKSYEKVTVIDTRYVNPELIEGYVEGRDLDVLFLYSTLLLNQSETMR